MSVGEFPGEERHWSRSLHDVERGWPEARNFAMCSARRLLAAISVWISKSRGLELCEKFYHRRHFKRPMEAYLPGMMAKKQPCGGALLPSMGN